MGIKHFKIDSGILCKTKGKNINLTDNEKDVSCKRCLKKLRQAKKDDIKPDNVIKFIDHKNLRYCLSINDVFIKIGDDLNDKITKMILSKDGGIVSTNIRFSGKKVLNILSENDILYLYEWFNKRIIENKAVYVHECKEFFGET